MNFFLLQHYSVPFLVMYDIQLFNILQENGSIWSDKYISISDWDVIKNSLLNIVYKKSIGQHFDQEVGFMGNDLFVTYKFIEKTEFLVQAINPEFNWFLKVSIQKVILNTIANTIEENATDTTTAIQEETEKFENNTCQHMSDEQITVYVLL